MTPLQPSYDATFDPDAPVTPLLLDAVDFLAGRELYAFLWCDDDLIVRESFGALGELAPVDQHVCRSLLPLMGFEEQIRALKRKPQRTVELPNLSIMMGPVQSPRININVFWRPPMKRFLVALSRVISRSDLEVELNHNIRARRIAESQLLEKSDEIARANRELTRVNGDLEEFAYVISHDLNAPLRALKILTSNLHRTMGNDATKDALADLARIADQTRRMSSMLTDLLDYASIGRKDEVMERVDTRALLQGIADSLPRPPGITLALAGTWPQIDTLRAPLDIVFRNLLENAVKHHDRETGAICITATPEEMRQEADGLYWTFEVRDDGPGIPRDYQEAVFHPFRKVEAAALIPDLQSDAAFLDDAAAPPQSTGIGLALVKKTVDSVGGRLVLTSDPDHARGARFAVYWPKQPAL
ncbi:MAG: HAMP domain-containing sensor histidine kinase [Pseudomonadota bacterium]